MRKKNGMIEFLRFLFVMCVISHHSMYLDGLPEGGFIPFRYAYMGVEFFLIITGYFIAKKAFSKTVSSNEDLVHEVLGEMKKRIYTILPIFIVSFLISFSIYHTVFQRWSLETVINDFMLSLDELSLIWMNGFVFKDFQYLGPMWFFSAVLLSLMVIYPLLLKVPHIFAGIIAPIISVFGYGYIYGKHGNICIIQNMAEGGGGVIRAFCGICLGIFIAYIVMTGKKDAKQHTKRFKIVIMLAQIGALAIILFNFNTKGLCFVDFINLFLMALIIYWNFIDEGLLEKLFANKIVYFLGKSSKALFISHTSLIWLRSTFYSPVWKIHYFQWMGITFALGIFLTIIEPYLLRTIDYCKKVKTVQYN